MGRKLIQIYFGRIIGSRQQQQLGLNACAPYLPLVWPARQSEAAVEHNDFILNFGLHTTGRVIHTPLSHIFFGPH